MARNFSSRSRDTIRAAIRRHVRHDEQALENYFVVLAPEPGERVTGASLVLTGEPHLPRCGWHERPQRRGSHI